MTCGSCHVSPPASDAHANMPATQSCGGCHGAGYVCTIATLDTTCQVDLTNHLDGIMEASGESSGNAACETCHSSMVSSMSSGAAHRHQMAAVQPGAAIGTYPTTAGAKLCTQCHVDHDLFRPDLNTSGTRAKNLRANATVQPSATTALDTDFSAAEANGGVCTSCHKAQLAKQVPGAPDDGGQTALVDRANYGGSAHDYVAPVGTAAFKDGSTFKPNCAKCHDDTNARAYQGTGGNAFTLHSSPLGGLTAPLGLTAPASPMEEDFCFRCHSRTSDALAGTKKATASKDWYGQQSMSGAAEGIYAVSTATPFKHNTTTYRGRHKAVGDDLSTVNRHVECGDCHDMHAARPRPPGTLAGSITAYAPGTPDTLTDSAQAWTANGLRGYTIRMVSGAQAGRTSAIYGSGAAPATQLLVKFPTAPAVGDKYVIVEGAVRLAPTATPTLSPALGHVEGVIPTFGALTPPVWNDSNGCGVAGTPNACEAITTSYGARTYVATPNAPTEAHVCIKCHSSYAYGTTPPSTPSGQPNVPNGTNQAWSNIASTTPMRQSDLAGDLNPNNAGHHAVFARGVNQPMVSSATVRSWLNPAWPKFTTGTIGVSGQTITVSGGTWPAGALPGWFLYLGSTAPVDGKNGGSVGWYEVTAISSATQLTIDRACAAPSTCNASGVPYLLTPGLAATFVPPWGPWSRLNCSDCHRSVSASDPLGPHGSANKWMLRSGEPQAFLTYPSGTNPAAVVVTTTPTDPNTFCQNCHRRDVYGDFAFNPTPKTGPVAGSVYTFSRQSHPADSSNGASIVYRTKWGIFCMNCHGGARQGGIHGENLGVGNGGTTALSYSGKRLLGGSSWYAVTRGSTATAGQCWTKGSTDAVDSCGHVHNGVNFQSGTTNYDYESTQGSSPVVR
jgi:hypothetical protein